MCLEQWFARRGLPVAGSVQLPLMQGAWLHISGYIEEFLAQTHGTCGRCTGEWRSRGGAQAWGVRNGPSCLFSCRGCNAVFTIAPQAAGYILHGHMTADLLILLRIRVELECKLGICCACIVCRQERLQAPFWRATGGPRPARAANRLAAMLPSRLAQLVWRQGYRAVKTILESQLNRISTRGPGATQVLSEQPSQGDEPEDMEEAYVSCYSDRGQVQTLDCRFCGNSRVIAWPMQVNTGRPMEMLCLACGRSFDNGRCHTPQRAYYEAHRLELICDAERRLSRRACCICGQAVDLSGGGDYLAKLACLCTTCDLARRVSITGNREDPLLRQLGLAPWMRAHSCHLCTGRLAVLKDRGDLSLTLCAGCGALRLIARHGLPQMQSVSRT